jgi:hypothetical protein
MEVEKPRSNPEHPRTAEVRAFLICDIRGYPTFTSQRGDEAAARLAMTFAGLARDAVVARGGRVIELRGDEAFAAFSSPGQSVRAGLEIYLACARYQHEAGREGFSSDVMVGALAPTGSSADNLHPSPGNQSSPTTRATTAEQQASSPTTPTLSVKARHPQIPNLLFGALIDLPSVTGPVSGHHEFMHGA